MPVGVLCALLAAVPAHAARTIEAETLKGAGARSVHESDAAGGHVLKIRPGGTASREVETLAVGAVVTRARGACALRVQVDGALPDKMALKDEWSERRTHVDLAPGRHVLRLSMPARRGCRARVDRMRLPAPAKHAAPAPAPVVKAPAPALPNAHIELGTAAQLAYIQKDAGFASALAGGVFKSFSPENELKMEWVQPEEGVWNFAAADSMLDFARVHNLSVRGHTLIFGKQTPSWVGRLLFPGKIDQALQDEVRTVMARYKGFIREWDVVNEALDDAGHYRRNAFYDALGAVYVDHAFMAARQADPTAKLFYNEFNADVANIKRAAEFQLVKRLADQHLIDGIGMQLHTAIGHAPTHELLIDTMKLWASLGLEVQITEMDVDAKGDASEPLDSRLARQADAYRTAALACAESANCTRFTVWGVSDKYSWLGADHVPLLLDANYAPKPALAAVQEALG